MNEAIYCLLVAMLCLVAAVSSVQLIRLVIRNAQRWGVLDLPNVRKVHSIPTPRLGGLGLAPAMWLGSSVALILAYRFPFAGLAENIPEFIQWVTGLMIGWSGAFFLGLIDDFRPLTAPRKLAGQVLIALVVINFVPIPESIMGFEVPVFMTGLIIFGWLVIIPNAVNLLDGVDGLTSTLSTLFMVFIMAFGIINNNFGWLILLMPLCIANLSFLRFNWKPAKIFLGDSGSLSLGFMVAYVSLIASFSSSEGGSSWNVMMSLAACSVWLADTALAIVRRYYAKLPSTRIVLRRSMKSYAGLQLNAVKNIARPDRHHLHHNLMKLGFKPQEVVYTLSYAWLMTILLVLPGLPTPLPSSFIGEWAWAIRAFGLIGICIGLFVAARTHQQAQRAASLVSSNPENKQIAA